eukprot:TRINITY_DN81225_c0_g1_i1.p1 TRINITY_DN81225_c0_g1~~TRINITY_DN81225_c0_g1_i1.p1  ORF type:complete len:1601 (+),score=458.56 TRINITY_DN81225_c0_g1_i1:48-4805(+)
MIAFDEDVLRTVVLLQPEVVLQGSAREELRAKGHTRVDDICATFEEHYCAIRCRKQLLLNESEAASLFRHLGRADCKRAAAQFCRGICEVVVLEDLDDEDTTGRTRKCCEALSQELGAGCMFYSSSAWECLRLLEFFFPHLDALPTERTLVVVKSDGLAAGSKTGKTLEESLEEQTSAVGLLVVSRREMQQVTDAEAQLLCADLQGTNDFHGAVGVLKAAPGAVALCLEGRGAVHKMQLICGPQSSGTAREVAPDSLRAVWGTDSTSNAVHCSLSLESADNELKAYFPKGAVRMQRTVCIVKPHAMGSMPAIRSELQSAGFTILREKERTFSAKQAAEFYAAHQGQSYYDAMISEAVAGPCAVMVLCRLEAVKVLQKLAGPADMALARRGFPHSLRCRFGADGEQNAVHVSESESGAHLEIRLQFPELGYDSHELGHEEVQDFLFRKASVESMGLKALSDAISVSGDSTLQQLLSQGLFGLCQAQPKGLAAVKWLSRWLAENNPNAPGGKFQPPARGMVHNGINRDGLSYSVTMPAAEKKKVVIDVDVSGEPQEHCLHDIAFKMPPFVVVVCGGPGVGKTEHCAKLAEEMQFKHLELETLMDEESQAGTHLGTEIWKYRQSDSGLVPDPVVLQLLRMHMVKHKEANRFLVSGFPVSAEQALYFEQHLAEIAYIIQLEASEQTMRKRVEVRAEAYPGNLRDAPETVEKAIRAYAASCPAIADFYGPIGKLRRVDAERPLEEVYSEVKRATSVKLLYLMAPPGAPLGYLGEKLESLYGYCTIDFMRILTDYAASGAKDAGVVRQALDKGQPVDCSIACPLLVEEIRRDLAAGVQNFVLLDFPQTLKQAQFIEQMFACRPVPLLLDLHPADAAELVTTLQAGRSNAQWPDADMRADEFYGAQSKQMMNALPGLTRLPCRLEALIGSVGRPAAGSNVSQEQKILDAAWQALQTKVRPSLTVVLGPTGSGTEALAGALASLTPGAQAVDVALLLQREMQRKTAAGVEMLNAFARQEEVALNTILNLLKDAVCQTSADSLVVLNLPIKAEQLPQVEEQFRVDRGFFIDGNSEALSAWKEACVAATGADGEKAFEERLQRSQAMATYFARRGRLERLEVAEEWKAPVVVAEVSPEAAAAAGEAAPGDNLSAAAGAAAEEAPAVEGEAPQAEAAPAAEEAPTSAEAEGGEKPVEAADAIPKRTAISESAVPTTLDFAIVAGLSTPITDKQANMAAAYAGAGSPLTLTALQQWVAERNGGAVLDLEAPSDVCAALKTYADTKNLPFLLLNNYPATAADATVFLDKFGPPKVFAFITGSEEFLAEEYAATHAEDENPLGEEEVTELLKKKRTGLEGTLQVFLDRCKKSTLQITWNPEGSTHDAVSASICKTLRPRVYVIVAPSGQVDFSDAVAEAVCISKREGQQPVKYTLLDAQALAVPGRHSAEIEGQLARIAVTGAAAGDYPISIWRSLFKEAFATSANPLGTFLVTNFPAAALSPGSMTVRDQFHLLEEAGQLMGMFYVKLAEDVYEKFCSEEAADQAAYRAFETKVIEQGKNQFDQHKLCECIVESAVDLPEVVEKIGQEFRAFQEISEK